MVDYKSMYAILFNSITDAVNILVEAQVECEKEYIESKDITDITVLMFPENDGDKKDKE